jgi:hypothetical protein
MKTKSEKEEIADSVKWFRKFPLEKRFEIAFKQISAINVLRKLKPQKNGKSG